MGSASGIGPQITASNKENPMSLGVLNNLSAVYAENNLNNTNNSLNTVLQQLSSGSKINSGADDAAGLSLVDGLQANQTGADPVADQRPGRRGPSAGGRWRALAGDQPAQPRRYAGYRGLERHAQHHAGRRCQPGVPVDPVGNLQHRFDDHLSTTSKSSTPTPTSTPATPRAQAHRLTLSTSVRCPPPTWATAAA